MENFGDILVKLESLVFLLISEDNPPSHLSSRPQKQVKSKGTVLLENKQYSVCLNYILDVPGNLEPGSSVGV